MRTRQATAANASTCLRLRPACPAVWRSGKASTSTASPEYATTCSTSGERLGRKRCAGIGGNRFFRYDRHGRLDTFGVFREPVRPFREPDQRRGPADRDRQRAGCRQCFSPGERFFDIGASRAEHGSCRRREQNQRPGKTDRGGEREARRCRQQCGSGRSTHRARAAACRSDERCDHENGRGRHGFDRQRNPSGCGEPQLCSPNEHGQQRFDAGPRQRGNEHHKNADRRRHRRPAAGARCHNPEFSLAARYTGERFCRRAQCGTNKRLRSERQRRRRIVYSFGSHGRFGGGDRPAYNRRKRHCRKLDCVGRRQRQRGYADGGAE